MLTTLLMLAAGGGAVFGLMKMKQGLEWGKGVLIVCTILALILAIYKIQNPMGGGTSKRTIARLRESEATIQKTSGEKLGRYLVEKFPGAKAVVFRPLFFTDVDPDAPPEAVPMMITQRLAGLRVALGDAIEILDVIHPPAPEDLLYNIEGMKKEYKGQTGKDDVPWEYYGMAMGYDVEMQDTMSAARFNELVKKIPADATMVIMLANFPDELQRSNLWKKKLTVAGIVNVTNANMASAIDQGYISALVIGNPKAEDSSESVPKDLDERFNRYFLLVTPDNVKEIAEANESLFQ